MPKVTVNTVKSEVGSVTLVLTVEEAQSLHSLLGDISEDQAKELMKKYPGYYKLIIGANNESVWDVLDNELHRYPNTFKGTIGRLVNERN